LIKQSFKIFFKKENMKLLLLVYLLLVPFSLLSLFKFNETQQAWIFGGASLVQIFITALVVPVAIILIAGIVSGHVISIGEAIRKAWKVYWKFMLLMFVLFLINTLGFILLIIPGILFLVWFYFAQFILVEGSGVKESILKSKQLVKGKFWKVFGRIVVIGLFSVLCQILLSFTPYDIGSALFTVFGALFVLPSYLLYRELASADNI
jgi:hypothetical protein